MSRKVEYKTNARGVVTLDEGLGPATTHWQAVFDTLQTVRSPTHLLSPDWRRHRSFRGRKRSFQELCLYWAEGGYELCRNWESQRVSLTESIWPKCMFIATFPLRVSSTMGTSRIQEKRDALGGYKRCIFCYGYHAPIIKHNRSFPALGTLALEIERLVQYKNP